MAHEWSVGKAREALHRALAEEVAEALRLELAAGHIVHAEQVTRAHALVVQALDKVGEPLLGLEKVCRRAHEEAAQ